MPQHGARPRGHGKRNPSPQWIRGTRSGACFAERISPSAASLGSAESSGVTREFPDFFATMNASDSSEVCDCGLRISPSRSCVSPNGCDDAPPRSPGSRCLRHVCACRTLATPGERRSLALPGFGWVQNGRSGVSRLPDRDPTCRSGRARRFGSSESSGSHTIS